MTGTVQQVEDALERIAVFVMIWEAYNTILENFPFFLSARYFSDLYIYFQLCFCFEFDVWFEI